MNKNVRSAAAEKTKTQQATWPDFAVGLYEKLSGRGSKITYELQDMEIFVPAKLGDTDHFQWKLNSVVSISSQDETNEEENA